MPKHSNTIERTCSHCGTAFFALVYDVKRGRGIYCGLSCKNIATGQKSQARSTSVCVECAYCGAKLWREPYQLLKHRFFYCSQSHGHRHRVNLAQSRALEITSDQYAIDAETGCWNWCKSKDAKGYGKMTRRGKQWLAHRVSWQQIHGAIPDGMELDHLCNNPSCVNPAHLEPVTHQENLIRHHRHHRHNP